MPPASTSKKVFYGKRLLAVSCLVFVFFWAGHWSLSSSDPTFPTAENPLVIYSNQTGSDLRLLFYKTLADAKKSIFLEMYAITDPDLIELLKAKAKHGIAVTILTDKKASSSLKRKLSSSIALLFHQGRGLMHRKVLVVDHELTLLGSANFTTTSLTLHDNLALAVLDQHLASFFEQDDREEPFSSTLNNQEIQAWKLPKLGQRAKNKILEELSGAKRSIQIAMFTLTDHALSSALIQAHLRGVKVVVALDYYTAGGSSKAISQKLLQAGIPLRTSLGAQLLHHKWALIDDTTLIAGSTNWTKSAFACNCDDFVIIRNLTEKQQKLMLRLWRSIEKMTQPPEVL